MCTTAGLIAVFTTLVLGGMGSIHGLPSSEQEGMAPCGRGHVLPAEYWPDGPQELEANGLKTRPDSFFLTTRHGLPSAITSSGMSLYTADCIPITTPLPMTVLSLTAQFSPMNERVPICVPPPSTVQLEMTEWLPITMSWPTTVLLETKEPGPTMHPGPIWAVGEIRALGSIRVASGQLFWLSF